MIEAKKSYRTRGGLPVRIYFTGGPPTQPIHGAIFDEGHWYAETWFENGEPIAGHSDHPSCLVEADPHGILPRHRELLAEAYEGLSDGVTHFNGSGLVSGEFYSLAPLARVALIALARLDGERGE